MSTNLRRASAPELSVTEIPGLRDSLLRSDLFGTRCSKDVQDHLLEKFHYRRYQKGDILISSGDRASTLFVILKGSVKIISDKYESVLAELGPGMIFGEIGAIFQVPRTASVVANEKGLVAALNRNDLKEVLLSHSEDKHIWDHLKGLAMMRYKSVRLESKSIFDPAQSEICLLQSKSFKNAPVEVVKLLSELAELKEFSENEIIEFCSPRAEHFLYLVKDGSVQLSGLSEQDSVLLSSGDSFVSYNEKIDFVKSLTPHTIILSIDAQQASAIFEKFNLQELGEQILGSVHLTDQIDANSSITNISRNCQIADLSSILNPAQFSRRRRNSTPVFSDVGIEHSHQVVPLRESIDLHGDALKAKPSDDADMKQFLMNIAGIIVPESVVLLFDGRLTLTPLKNELTDSVLSAVVSSIGSELKVLNLSDCHLLTNAGILAVWLHCPQLTKISLQGCWNLDDSAFSTLERCVCAESLKEISLAHNPRFTSKLFEFIGAVGLERLDLSYCKGLDDRTWPALTQFASTLRSLNLKRCLGITDCSLEGIHGVVFNELSVLNLSECALLTDSAISTVLSSAPNLRSLNLSLSTSLKGSFLFHHEKLPNLKVLNISHLSEMVNETFCSRLVSVCFNLEEVDLSGCTGLDDDCIAFFNESNLVNLKVLKFDSCPLISALTGEILNLKYNQ